MYWDSLATTRADSDTGLRYQRHVEMWTAVMLFARLRTDERSIYFLGPATYVKHEGELPMAITWRPEGALPGAHTRRSRRRWREGMSPLEDCCIYERTLQPPR